MTSFLWRRSMFGRRACTLGLIFAHGVFATPPAGAVLTTAAQVRALSESEARQARPVHLRGIFIGEADPEGIAFVIQDSTDGIYVQGPADLVAGASRGDLLEIEGVTDPGGFAPYVVAQSLRKVGRGDLPEPIRVTLDELNAGQMDAKWVEISGVVRSVEPKAPSDNAPPPPGTRHVIPSATGAGPRAPKTKLKLASGSARLVVQVSGDVNRDDYVDAEVRLRGLCFNLHNRNRQFVRPFVQVPRGVPILVDKPPPDPVACAQPQSIASLFQFEQLSGNRGHCVHVRGVVIHHQPGTALWLRDGDHSLRVETTQREPLQPGDEVDVAGFPALGDYSAVLEDGIFRKRAALPAPLPHVVADVPAAVRSDADLVQFDARLSAIRRFPDHVALILDWNQAPIRAQIRLPDGVPTPADWLPGSLVRAAGVCSVLTAEAGPLGGLWEPRAFELLLRSPADLAVLVPAPWWTSRRVVWALSASLVVTLGIVALVMLASRRRLHDQERRRAMAETEFAAILNERNRVAREIHDTLSQNLGAISVQLELVRTQAGEMSPPARQHLETAHRLARAALADARESIWDMRSQVLERYDLGQALEHILTQMTEGTDVAGQTQVDGPARRLPPVVENNLLRIGQEAITNANKHAQPSRIAVRLAFDGRTVRLSVEDDGVGFIPGSLPKRDGRSFGLVGMKERAELLGGTFDIKSSPGGGTRVRVSIKV